MIDLDIPNSSSSCHHTITFRLDPNVPFQDWKRSLMAMACLHPVARTKCTEMVHTVISNTLFLIRMTPESGLGPFKTLL